MDLTVVVVHAVLHRRGILTPQGDRFTRSGRAFLEQASLDQAGRTILDRFTTMMDHLDATLTESAASPLGPGKRQSRRPQAESSVAS